MQLVVIEQQETQPRQGERRVLASDMCGSLPELVRDLLTDSLEADAYHGRLDVDEGIEDITEAVHVRPGVEEAFAKFIDEWFTVDAVWEAEGAKLAERAGGE